MVIISIMSRFMHKHLTFEITVAAQFLRIITGSRLNTDDESRGSCVLRAHGVIGL